MEVNRSMIRIYAVDMFSVYVNVVIKLALIIQLISNKFAAVTYTVYLDRDDCFWSQIMVKIDYIQHHHTAEPRPLRAWFPLAIFKVEYLFRPPCSWSVQVYSLCFIEISLNVYINYV